MKVDALCVHVSEPVARPRGRAPNLNDSVCYMASCCFFHEIVSFPPWLEIQGILHKRGRIIALNDYKSREYYSEPYRIIPLND
jgi:hypothetical protein